MVIDQAGRLTGGVARHTPLVIALIAGAGCVAGLDR